MRKIHLFMEGNSIAATWDDFDCLATSPAGFGDVIGEAVADLVKNSSASVINAIVCGIENERYEKRAQQLKAEIAALVVKVDAIPQRDLPLMVGEFIERMRQLSAV